METSEQALIDGLFERLKMAEQQSTPRDPQAEAQINRHLAGQPSAPYYMAQVILIQEAALKRLDQRVKDLEAQVAAQARNRPSSGGFLAGLFGAGNRDSAPPAPAPLPGGAWSSATPGASSPGASTPGASTAPGTYAPGGGYGAAPAQPSRMGGFLGGALQTAAGVAGGVMLADMLSGLFHHSNPQEIVEIIQPPAQDPHNDQDVSFLADSDLDTSHMTPDQFGGSPGLADAGGTDGFGEPGFSEADFEDDPGFFSDDDTFV